MRNLPTPFQVIAQALLDWWDDWINMVVVNLVWALSWLTIVLGPPATLGVYFVTNELAHGRSLGLGGLLEGVRRYFLKSWVWTLLNLGVAVMLWASNQFYGQIDTSLRELLPGFSLILGLFWLLIQFYALPYLMEQENKSVRLMLRNGLFTVLAAPGYTLVVVGTAALIAALSIVLVLPLLLGGPCLISVLGNRAVLDRLEAFRVRERDALRGDSPEREL